MIPARGGSTRIPRKNLAHLHGATLLERAIKCASGTGEHFIVSTDDAQTYERCQQLGAPVFARDSQDDGPMVDVLRLAMQSSVARKGGPEASVVVCLQPTSPLRNAHDVGACLSMFYANEARSVVSVDATTGQRNGAVYVTRRDMIYDKLVFDDDSLKYPMPHERSLDINTPEDLEEARRILGP